MNFFVNLFAKVDPQCGQGFFGLPPWYKYLDVKVANQCAPELTSLNHIWLIALAVLELLIRIAIYVAIGYIIFAGIKYSESRGNVDKATAAKNTLIDAITGLIIALVAVAVISFIAGRFVQ